MTLESEQKSSFVSEELELLAHFRHEWPHRFLGLHSLSKDSKVIRIWRPGAEKIYVDVKGFAREAEKVHELGLFECKVSHDVGPFDYRIYHQNGLLAHDPYVFSSTFGDIDAFLFNKGVHYEIYNALGSHPITHEGVEGVKFAVWAPNAAAVYLVADFNYWDGRVLPMRKIGASGVFELFVPGIGIGEKYKYELRTREGFLRVKSDPYAQYFELRPNTASLVYDVKHFAWEDQEFLQQRKSSNLNIPMNIYEVHLGSWRKIGNREFPNYKDLAHELAAYCKEMHFSHVELMPVMEHPLDESWGYQVTGYFAATSRYGTPDEFQYFVNHMHKNGIGVILDWVPAHFPTDDYSLSRFDGTSLYEHEDPMQGYHPHWNTAIFNYGRTEVVNFLLGSALYWLEMMHIDGLRVDAVASMLYLDYGREKGQWIPNQYGGNHNLQAIEFLKHLNSIVHERNNGVLMIAEESTAFRGVTHPLNQEGLGFDLKWNMGWMNDTLRFFSKDPVYRNHHHNDLTFGLIYAFSEKFICVLSHDEVVHGKRSLIDKMPGDEWQRFANLRLLYSYLICQPEKKLIFMGSEIAQSYEWNPRDYVHWHLLQYPLHQKMQVFVKDINEFYQTHKSLWEIDFSYEGFEWIDFSDSGSSVISYLRKGRSSLIAVVHNFTPVYRPDYFIRLGNLRSVREVFNTDHENYGGSGKLNQDIKIIKNDQGNSYGFTIKLSPLATMIFEVEFAN